MKVGTVASSAVTHRRSETAASKVISISIQVVDGIRYVDLVRLEERVQCLTCLQSEQTAQLRLRETAQPELLDSKRFQDPARQIAGGP